MRGIDQWGARWGDMRLRGSGIGECLLFFFPFFFFLFAPFPSHSIILLFVRRGWRGNSPRARGTLLPHPSSHNHLTTHNHLDSEIRFDFLLI
jgi:hypothetical protein